MKKILYCDFDGTLIAENSEEMLVKYLQEIHFFSWKHYFLAALGVIINTPRRMCYKENIMKAWPAHMDKEKKKRLLDEFICCNKTQLHLNSSVVNLVKSFEGQRILLSGSDTDLLKEYLKSVSLESEFDQIYGCTMAPNGIRVLEHPYGKSKVKYVDQNAMSVGIANEVADCFYLRKCKKVYVVKGDLRAEKIANENNWSLI